METALGERMPSREQGARAADSEPIRLVFWGTYDLSKPRGRILLRGLRENGVSVVECHADVWSGVADKSQIQGLVRRAAFLCRWILSYPGLILRYLALPRHDAVMVGYMGQLDVLVLWPFARLRGVTIVWDAFLSLYDTVVEDRKIAAPGSLAAKLLFAVEWLSCRAADRVVLDTRAHADYFESTFRMPPGRTAVVHLGVEPQCFRPRPSAPAPRPRDSSLKVLFYGQFIPLHGIETIIRAAQSAGAAPIDWTIIGGGQEEGKIRNLLREREVARLTWIPWVGYRELNDWIHRADVCLGIFGESGKAGRVIPNKIFQVLATGTPLITRDSPAIRELLSPDMAGVYLVPPADPDALLAALRRFIDRSPAVDGIRLFDELRARIAPKHIGAQMVEVLNSAIARRRKAA